MPAFTLLPETPSINYPNTSGICLLVTLYTIAHDQYIVRIALQQRGNVGVACGHGSHQDARHLARDA